MLRELEAGQRPPNDAERVALSRWSGWGALPAVFDQSAAGHAHFAAARVELRRLLPESAMAAAERSTINAHYTDPAYVEAIWDSLRKLGFDGGDVLEPGCGSGNFLRYAPAKANLVGVELDATTASIAAALYPNARIRAESFADTPIAEATFDLVVGNVPFGDVVLHDRRHNVSRHRIHNHFILKSLQLTRPGGLVAVLTSRYTLDATNPSARREIAELAELVGAVRLPTGAHWQSAGTQVVTDLLILRRRRDSELQRGAAFERALDVDLGGDNRFRINEYFADHPEHVLGTFYADQGDRGRSELGVEGDRKAGPALAAALQTIVASARVQDLTLSERGDVARARPVALTPQRARKPDGALSLAPTGFTRVEEGVEVPYHPPASQAAELRALLQLRDTVVTVLEAEAASNDNTPELEHQRAALNHSYDQYLAAYGPLNRFTERRTGRVDSATGEDKLAQIRPRQGGFRSDSHASVVYALEHFDGNTQTATKSTIFRERVICRPERRLGADTPADALSICMDSFGEARIDEVARLLGVSSAEARTQLGTLVFDEPGTDRLVPAAEYLSGNVRDKLDHAQTALARDSRFAANVDALRAVLPRDLGPDEIRAQLGAAWLERTYVERFLRETLEDTTVRVEHPGGSIWVVASGKGHSVASTTQWGTERCPATAIAQTLLEQRPLRIYDVDPHGERTFNEEATLEAIEKGKLLSERFSEWVWEEPQRATELARIYNKRFNALVPRSYDDANLTLPGLALTFRPRPHQVAAVARVIHEPAVGLYHEVGAGKTAEIVIAAMEQRRLGLVKKPAVIVPNHMLEQFSREWLQMYPQAKLLAASNEDLDRENRRLFVAKCATGDWDAVVMTRGAFERIPMSSEAQRAYLQREVEGLEALVERARNAGENVSLKRLEKMKLNTEERIKDKLDSAKDPGITFEQLGIDYLYVDEAHAYKNLRTASNIPGMAVDGSQRATDLDMKINYLRERHARWATLATATPIANSMGEAYTMQRYLRPDLLEAVGIRDFDQWAATFGQTITSIEVTPDGSSMRMQTRFAKFSNVPELLQLWQVSADIKTADDLKLPVPALVVREDGKRQPETVVVPSGDMLRAYVAELAARAERVRSRLVDRSRDNMLKVSSDGRAAGLDMRLVGQSTDESQKVDVAATRIAAIYAQHRETRYRGADGEEHPRPGALQLVFSDLGTPKSDAWNVYDELRALLVARGVPRETIRFMHEAANDRQKAELFAACRDGRIAVLMGSTERMGVGTNVQLRAVALHHLDCPWRPADIAQREGRILRQGNANAEIQILRYVSERSFDTYLWQTVSRKAQFIAQIMRGRLDVREIEDIGDSALSYHEVKALAAGNPRLLEHAQVQAEVTGLERLSRAHAKKQATLRWSIARFGEHAAAFEKRVAEVTQALEHLAGCREVDGFSLTVAGQRIVKRGEANVRLQQALESYAARCGGKLQQSPVPLGELRGFSIQAAPHVVSRHVTLSLARVPSDSPMVIEVDAIAKSNLVARLENRLKELPALRENDRAEIERIRFETSRAREELEKPFRHAQLLGDKRAALADLEERIRLDAEPRPPSPIASELTTGGAVLPQEQRGGALESPAPTVSQGYDSESRSRIERLEREFRKPVQRIPDAGELRARVARVEHESGGLCRAVLVTERAIYVLSGFPPDAERFAGGEVVVVRTQGGIRMAPRRERRLEPER